jgi:DNA-binding GntR family transcriptional regulator
MRTDRGLALPQTRAQAVADEIRRAVYANELPGGSRLLQNDLAADYGVSGTTVREALAQLEREGLVRRDTHHGAVVFKPTIEHMRENYEMRIVLESLAASIAAVKITDAEVAALTALVQRMGGEHDGRAYVTLNREFHALIYAAAGRPELAGTIAALRDASVGYLWILASEPSVKTDPSQAEHEAILAGLQQRSPSLAAEATAEHLRSRAREIATYLDTDFDDPLPLPRAAMICPGD